MGDDAGNAHIDARTPSTDATGPVQTLSQRSIAAEERSNVPRHKAAEALARRIEAEIIAAGWRVDTYLGSEAELVARYDVSRSVLREAIRLLEHNSVATMRTGPGGGLVVTAPDVSAVAAAAALFLDYRKVRPAHLYNARSAIELKCLDLALDRLTPDDMERLRAVLEHESAKSALDLVQTSHELHELIAELSGDPALRLFTKVLMNLTGEHAGPADETAVRATTKLRRTRHDHRAIVDAMIRGSRPEAQALMADHLQWIALQMEQAANRRGYRP